ncbi:MAG: CDP-alcohol phosphatidyltransferase family protein [Gammaproteobacteria bacterium]|nr:CDP-alcohol phosphatidyltransferase family protein [Gammaproteobacteria bacterium]
MTTTVKPWDARLAAWLVAPLCNSTVTPNLLTTIRLLVGTLGALLFAHGEYVNFAALAVVVSNFLDHTDGELARMSGKTSRFGHNYDLTSDAFVTVGLFIGIGWGLAPELGTRAIWMGLLAGAAVAGIFQLRNLLENQHGKVATAQARLAGVEAEDILYLLPLVTLSDGLPSFLYAAAVGAPAAFVIVLIQYRRWKALPS